MAFPRDCLLICTNALIQLFYTISHNNKLSLDDIIKTLSISFFLFTYSCRVIFQFCFSIFLSWRKCLNKNVSDGSWLVLVRIYSDLHVVDDLQRFRLLKRNVVLCAHTALWFNPSYPGPIWPLTTISVVLEHGFFSFRQTISIFPSTDGCVIFKKNKKSFFL